MFVYHTDWNIQSTSDYKLTSEKNVHILSTSVKWNFLEVIFKQTTPSTSIILLNECLPGANGGIEFGWILIFPRIQTNLYENEMKRKTTTECTQDTPKKDEMKFVMSPLESWRKRNRKLNQTLSFDDCLIHFSKLSNIHVHSQCWFWINGWKSERESKSVMSI